VLTISDYVTKTDDGMVFSETQASHFAKGVAGDFNPIHDVGAKRFCVPGDLLFAALLDRYGLHQNLHVDLVALVNADVQVVVPQSASGTTSGTTEFMDEKGRHLLSLTTSGEHTDDASFVNSLALQYVQFSGKTFPDILVPLMREHNVMINPARPLVIYKDMTLKLDRLTGENLTLEDAGATLDVDGKKGKACLRYTIKDGTETIGSGEKNMLLSGLRPFEEPAMSDIVDQYNAWRSAYANEANDSGVQ